ILCDDDAQDNYYEVQADEQGDFEKEVRLTNVFDQPNIRLSEGLEALSVDGEITRNAQDTNTSTAVRVDYSSSNVDEDGNLVRIIAYDKTGQFDTVESRIRYATCGTDHSWNVILGEVDP